MSIKFPKHDGALHLTHNQHKSYYETVVEAENSMTYSVDDWISEDQRTKAIETNNVWELQWYPSTPVGFNRLQACDLDVLLATALEMERKP